MDDQDYIRKAVELADRFVDSGIFYMSRGLSFGPTEGNNPPQAFKDALAAQLVRQVDAMKRHSVMTNPPSSVVCHPARTNKARGPDRTMNTIKAIVDSGVLNG